MTTKKFPAWKEQIKSPQWQKKRLEILNLRGFKCEKCGCEEKTLHVHHRFYINGRLIHEYDNDVLQVLCEDCHKKEHSDEPKQEIDNKYDSLIKLIENHISKFGHDTLCDLEFIIEQLCSNDDNPDFLSELSQSFNGVFYQKIAIDMDMNSRLERLDIDLFLHKNERDG